MLWRETPTASASCCCVQPRSLRSSFTRLRTFGVMSSQLSTTGYMEASIVSSRLYRGRRGGRRASVPGWLLHSHPFPNGSDIPDGPDLDRAVARPRKLRRHLHRFFHAVGLDQVEAGQEFLGLGERAVGDRHFVLATADCLRRRRAFQHLRIKKPTFLLQVVGMRQTAPHLFVELWLG